MKIIVKYVSIAIIVGVFAAYAMKLFGFDGPFALVLFSCLAICVIFSLCLAFPEINKEKARADLQRANDADKRRAREKKLTEELKSSASTYSSNCRANLENYKPMLKTELCSQKAVSSFATLLKDAAELQGAINAIAAEQSDAGRG